jgi:hypothetical protein
MTGLACGSAHPGYNPTTFETQCGAFSFMSCTDAVSGFCYINTDSSDFTASSLSVNGGYFSFCNTENVCAAFPRNFQPSDCTLTTCTATSQCYDGQECSNSVCTGRIYPHVIQRVPWAAEGQVTQVNAGGTVNVTWSRIQVLDPRILASNTLAVNEHAPDDYMDS